MFLFQLMEHREGMLCGQLFRVTGKYARYKRVYGVVEHFFSQAAFYKTSNAFIIILTLIYKWFF